MMKATLEITKMCNFKCYFCYADDRIQCGEDLTTSDVLSLVDSLAELGVFILEITGGEPFMRRDINEIIEYASSKKFVMSFYSNGFLINDSHIDKMCTSMVSEINISLLSPIEEKFDELSCLSGSFIKVIENAKKLKAKDLPVYFGVTITKANIDDLDLFRDISNLLSIPIKFKYNIIPTYSSNASVEGYSLDDSDVSKLVNLYKGKENYNLKIGNNFCGPAKYKLSFDNEGNIYPCKECKILLGNIKKENLKALWDSKKVISVSEKLTQDNTIIKDEKCKSCLISDYCFYCPGIMKRYSSKEKMCTNAKLMKKIERGLICQEI